MPELRFRTLEEADLAMVMPVEHSAYAHPWSEANFRDALAAGYVFSGLEALASGHGGANPPGTRILIGYSVWMPVLEEGHLLNLTVAPSQQGRGSGKRLLTHVAHQMVAHGLSSMLLEVRAGNLPAYGLYQSMGFACLGVRKGYYPAERGQREDAVVMRCGLPQGPWQTCCGDAAGDVPVL